jgi:hypothetical protein
MTMAGGIIPALDAILKAQAATSPDALALIDAPDCEGVAGAASRTFTYAQADAAVDALAWRFREIGLPPGSVVAIQMPNVAASVVTLLGVMRAGMIAAPLPLLWRRADCVAALSEAGARAIVTCGRVGGFDHAQLALDIAAELFPIRAVCGFGCGTTDGIVPLDDLLSGADEHPDSILFRDDGPPSPHAVVTFDVTADGIVPVARNAAQLLAAGRLIRQRGGIGSRAVILSTLPFTSAAAIAAALIPWLLSGGALALHLPFDPNILRAQVQSLGCTSLVVPDAMLPDLSGSGLLEAGRIGSVISVWRAPERLAGATQWTNLDVALVDVASFGERALLAARRPPAGRSLPWPAGAITIANGGPECAHIALMPGGTLGVRGALTAVPFRPYDTETAAEPVPDSGHVDTGYACRTVPEEDALIVTAPPAGLIAVGGYHFSIHDLQDMVRDADANGVLAALPHAVTGHRLAGAAANPAAMRIMLNQIGATSLLPAAFRDRAT